MRNLIDMHTHILPLIDDGSHSSEMSVEMIKGLVADGVKKIVLTPHFYASEGSVDEFLERRAKSLERLKGELGGESVGAEIYLGAEVLFMDSLDKVDGFERMAIDGTKYLLLEMPFAKWSSRTLETVYRIINGGITPIIAHFERYIPFQDSTKSIYELKRMGCILQMNAENFDSFFNKRKALKFFAEGTASLLGSDCHNLTSRPPKIKTAYDSVAKKLGEERAAEIVSLGERILKGANRVI